MTDSVLTKSQQKKITKIYPDEDGVKERLDVYLRYDDKCGNGHNTFSMTADQYRQENGRWEGYGGGCIHDEIVKRCPELDHLVKWHLCTSDGPTYYIRNTIYLASDKDCWGYRKGEPCGWKEKIFFGDHPLPFTCRRIRTLTEFVQKVGFEGEAWKDIQPVEVGHPKGEFESNYTLSGMGECAWHECHFDSKDEAERFIAAMSMGNARIERTPVSWSKGKEPELEAARKAAIWPGATLEQLRDQAALEARLPALLAEFRKDIEALGFTW